MKGIISKLVYSIGIGLIFVIPHAVRILRIGSFYDYTPYTASSPSATVADESFMYVSEVNYTLQHWRLAYDTDAYEHRNDPFTFSVLPAAIEVVIAKAVGDLRIAQIICHFLFPATTALLLMIFFCSLDAPIDCAALLALGVLVFGFSLRTVFNGNISFLAHGLNSGFIETLQAARNPHPNMSFPNFLVAILCLINATLKRSWRYALSAGALGGLLFYSYSFYAISWSIACLLLVSMALPFVRIMPGCLSIALIADAIVAFPYFLWMHQSKLSGAFANRAVRLGLINSHLPSRQGTEITLIYLSVIAASLLAWRVLSISASHDTGTEDISRRLTTSFVIWVSMALGGICGLNMQIVTGFNIEPEHHFPHMVIQPCILVLIALILLLMRSHRPAWRKAFRIAPFALILLSAVACISQVNSGYNSAQYHRIRDTDRRLFDWLQMNSAPFDVVSTTDMRLNIIIPDYTHNDILVVNGSRSSGTDDEIVERFLLANALAGVPPSEVRTELSEDYNHQSSTSDRIAWTYSYYMFEHSRYFDTINGNIQKDALPALLAVYGDIQEHLGEELSKYRVNFLLTSGDEIPAQIPGWRVTRELETRDAVLWKLRQP